MKLKQENLCIQISLILLFVIAAISMVFNIYLLTGYFFIDGPNTLGEAGKVFYSNRIKEGLSWFLPGNAPPFYPSFHGVFTHMAVGIPAWLFNLDFSWQYYLGRCFSLISLAVSLWFGCKILKFYKIPRLLVILWIMLVLSAPASILFHAISYRPDFWNLAICISCFYLLIKQQNKLKYFILILTLCIIAFFIKATGLIIAGAVFWTYLASGKIKRAFIFGAVLGISLLAVIFTINFASGGMYFKSFMTGMKVIYSIDFPITFLSIPFLWLPVAAIIISVIPPTIYKPAENKGIYMFPTIIFIGAFLACLRQGSAAYYFIDTIFIGLILTITILSSKLSSANQDMYKVDSILLLLLTAVLVYSTQEGMLSKARTISIARTEQFSSSRTKAAQYINNNNLYCFSDDPGLNIMLKKPAVIYPINVRQFEKSGFLPAGFRAKLITQRKYDIIYLTGINWKYYGGKAIPRNILDAIKLNYKNISSNSNYLVFIRKPEVGQKP